MGMAIIRLECRDPQPEMVSLASLIVDYVATVNYRFLTPTEYRRFQVFLFFWCHVFLTVIWQLLNTPCPRMSNTFCEEQADEGEVVFYSPEQLNVHTHTHTHFFQATTEHWLKVVCFKEARQRSTGDCLPKMAPWKLHNSLSSVWGYRKDGFFKNTKCITRVREFPKLLCINSKSPP